MINYINKQKLESHFIHHFISCQSGEDNQTFFITVIYGEISFQQERAHCDFDKKTWINYIVRLDLEPICQEIRTQVLYS